ncbi:TadE/TadG family type IV pilus assembly protein [Thalassotalea ponticola]|uniref:TadE/TadG family type IV pilus assembly protein n=1 Tax=Thalassotalea ponticola TaxID=1523392 RepID=UPI0025B5253B|nr:TadE/TadG family type IV pilus assembly protein [Thalassotalea ponticola]MDN3651728.1 TadE/TadG family type IV pilus assembly protein [Thalassotalea ponticola]
MAAIEFTLILPLLLFFTFVVAEFSRLLYQYNALNHIARDALRYAINDARDGSTGNVSTTNIAAESRNIAMYGGLTASGILLPNLAATDFVFTDAVGTDGEFITLTVTYDWQPLIFSQLPLFVSANRIDMTFPLVVRYTMRAL